MSIASTPNGMRVEAKPNGKRVEAKPNGKRVEAKPNGKRAEAKPNGKRVEAKLNGKRVEAKLNGKRMNPKIADEGGRGSSNTVQAARGSVPRKNGNRPKLVEDPASAYARAHREPPARTGPNRSMSNAFRSVNAAEKNTEADTARRAVESAVETAYRICEDYLSWGRAAASSRSRNSGRSDEWREDMKRHPYAMGGMNNPVMKWWQDMASFWMGYAMPDWQGGSGAYSPDDRSAWREQNPCGPPDGHRREDDRSSHEQARATPSLKRVHVRVPSSEEVTVTATVEVFRTLPEREKHTLRLRNDDQHLDVELKSNLGELWLSFPAIRVRPGDYTGILRDEARQTVAVIEVKIE